MINLIFRYDDYSYSSNIVFEQSLLKIFSKYKIPITLGVIPYEYNDNNPNELNLKNISLIQKKIYILKTGIDTNLIEIAQHGHSHHNYQKTPRAEFQGIQKKNQEKLIVDGKKLIEKVFRLKLKTFIPPWNRYNKDTVQIIESNGFENLSAGEKGLCIESNLINYIPSTCNIKEFIEIINNNIFEKNNNATFIVLLHEYDFIDKKHNDKITLDDLDLLLKKLFIDNRFSFYTIKGFTKDKTNFSIKYDFSYYKIIRFLRAQLPLFLNEKITSPKYLPNKKFLTKILFIVAAFYFSIISFPTLIILIPLFRSLDLTNWTVIKIIFLISTLFSITIIHLIKKNKLYKRSFRFSFFLLGLFLCMVLNLTF